MLNFEGCLSGLTSALTLSRSHDLPLEILPLFIPPQRARILPDLSEITKPSLKTRLSDAVSFLLEITG